MKLPVDRVSVDRVRPGSSPPQVWLASGLPGDFQPWSLLHRVPRVIATVGYNENYWGGCNRIRKHMIGEKEIALAFARITRYLSDHGDAVVVQEEFWHAREDEVPLPYSVNSASSFPELLVMLTSMINTSPS